MKKRRERGILIGVLLAVTFIATVAGSAGADYIIVPAQQFGARALGMGGAFVAVADGAETVSWNPAGLALPVNDQTLALGGNLSLREEAREEWLIYNIHEAEKATGSLAWLRGDYFITPFISLNTGLPDELWYKNSNFIYTVAAELTPNFYGGFSIKSLSDNIYGRFDGDAAQGSAVSFDMGVAYRWGSAVTLGLAASDVNSPLTTLDGLYEFYDPVSGDLLAVLDSVKHPVVITTGLAVRPTDNLTLAFDVYDIGRNAGDSQVRLGLEYKPIPALALRLGSMDGRSAIGVGVEVGPVSLDFASVNTGLAGSNISYLSAGLVF